jgi:calcineurin-like phosphoesterase family protein
MSKIWITSDTHFGHVNICGPSMTRWKDGFRNFSSLAEMEDTIVDGLNNVVAPEDTLYHLGDVFMGQVEQNAKRIRERIKCNDIILIYGNHDKKIRKDVELQRLFSSCHDLYELRMGRWLMVMSHYPMVVWDENGRDTSMHFHGHCHGSYEHPGRAIDVGVDCWDFKPLRIEDALMKALQKPKYTPDHHGQNTSYS